MGFQYLIIPNCSYKVIQYQILQYQKFYENSNIYTIIADLRVREEIQFN